MDTGVPPEVEEEVVEVEDGDNSKGVGDSRAPVTMVEEEVLGVEEVRAEVTAMKCPITEGVEDTEETTTAETAKTASNQEEDTTRMLVDTEGPGVHPWVASTTQGEVPLTSEAASTTTE